MLPVGWSLQAGWLTPQAPLQQKPVGQIVTDVLSGSEWLEQTVRDALTGSAQWCCEWTAAVVADAVQTEPYKAADLIWQGGAQR